MVTNKTFTNLFPPYFPCFPVLVDFLIVVIKYLTSSNLKEESFILTYNLRKYSSLLWGRHDGHSESVGHPTSTVRKQNTDRKWVWAEKPRPASSDSLPSTNFYFKTHPHQEQSVHTSEFLGGNVHLSYNIP